MREYKHYTKKDLDQVQGVTKRLHASKNQERLHDLFAPNTPLTSSSMHQLCDAMYDLIDRVERQDLEIGLLKEQLNGR